MEAVQRSLKWYALQLNADDTIHPGDVKRIKGGKAKTHYVEGVLPVEDWELVEQAGLVGPTVKKALRLICLGPVIHTEGCYACANYRFF